MDLCRMAFWPLHEYDHFRMSHWRNRIKNATLKEDLALYHCGLKEMSPSLMAIEDKVRVNGGWPF